MLEADASWAHEDAQLDGTLHFSNSYILCTRNEHFPHEPSYCRVSSIVTFFKLQPKAPWVVCRADSASRKAARSSSRFFITRLPTVYQTPPFYSASLLLTAMSPSVLSAASRAGSVFLLWMKHRFGSGRVAQALLTAGSQFQLCLRCTCVALNQ